MVLVDWEIIKWAEAGGIYPFFREHVNPASIDITIDNYWRDLHHPDYINHDQEISIYQATPTVLLHNWFIDQIHKVVGPGVLKKRFPTSVLLSTREVIRMPRTMVAEVKLKTTPTREGLGHPIADWVDNGFEGQLTMMMYANKHIKLKAGRRVCQLVLHKTFTPDKDYSQTGHYHRQAGPTPSWRTNKGESDE